MTTAPSADRSAGQPSLENRLEQALASGAKPPVGRYQLDLAAGTWEWSDEVYEMHGFEPGEIVPTTPLILSHKHPDDRDRVDGVLRRAAETGEPFSSVHRIVDAQGRTRTLAVTGQGRRAFATGRVTELFGYFIDVTEVQREAAAREATASIKASAEQWSGIEQAKGVLMVVYGIDEETAMGVLREASNRSNVAVRDIAYSLVHLFSGSDVTVVPTSEAIEKFLADPVLPSDL
ncbi:PAS and ANTAR domain-containing protein [Promicromonospora panici]|uniref:PAS and ANTAR domain-containing protein n=1 Tax=Promicromonospora panici TaxID=2219658 RepID=UPI00101DFA28|nr:PAS and ANTAR domain-containing protein [Promicromonospora panici]